MSVNQRIREPTKQRIREKKKLSKEQAQQHMYLHIQNVELDVKKSQIMECYQDEDVAFFMFGFNM